MISVAVVFACFSLALSAPQPQDVQKSDSRIVGGHSTTIEEFPYIVSLRKAGSHTCGAVIISEDYLVTAAHCTFGDQPSALEVRAGSSFRLEGGTMYYVQSIIQHPQYNNNTGDYDITILKLTTPLALGPGIAPITLASADRPIVAGEWGNLTGWGRFVEGGQTARQLQVVEVPVLDHDECYRTYYWIRKVTDRMLCAGIENKGGKASCNGDSGGPFVIDGVLVGLVSWAWGCARPNYHDVYASIPALRGFIYDTVGI